MDYRGVFLVVTVIGAAAAAAAACSAPDPGQISFSERPHQGAEPGSSGVGSSGTASGGTSSGSDGGGGGDGGSSGTANDPVFGTDAFKAGTAPNDSTQGAGHLGAGAPGATGNDCMTCHTQGGNAGPWAAAGTVYGADGKTAAAGAEVAISDGAGKVLAKTYTDSAGNFAIDPANLANIPTGARVGVRDATKKTLMSGTITGPTSSCNKNGCHNTNMPIKLQ